VGFNVGDTSKGVTYVDDPTNTRVNSKESLTMAKLCEDLVRGSGLPPYSKPTLMGFWRIFLYRESQVTKQALISLVVSEGQGDVPDTLKNEIVKKFSNALETRKVVSISLIYSSEISGGYKETDRVE
jgi:hypothetical protein